jgi:hypothetical protein
LASISVRNTLKDDTSSASIRSLRHPAWRGSRCVRPLLSNKSERSCAALLMALPNGATSAAGPWRCPKVLTLRIARLD